MVRLKVTSPVPETLTDVAFQFLMVRLKGLVSIPLDQFVDISIPYGAIKSFSASPAATPFPRISIPYGAIKSVARHQAVG